MGAKEDVGNLGLEVMDQLEQFGPSAQVKNIGVVMSVEYDDPEAGRQSTVLYHFKDSNATEVTGLLEYARRAIFKSVGLS